tara:strand:+ start:302 stop:541 length:240 start_codon:yes stop_codon:yes gene_type:complete
MNAFQTLEQTFLHLPFSKLEQVLENYCDIAKECMEEQGEEITDKAVREDAINCFLNNLNDMPREDALAVLADIIADILN